MATPFTHCFLQGCWSAALMFPLLIQSDRAVAREGFDIAQPLRIELSDGRTVSGTLDSQTTADRLWLRSEADGAQLTSSFDWSSITAAFQGERPISARALHSTAAALESRPAPLDSESNSLPRPAFLQAGAVPEPLPSPAPRVQSLRIESTLANWDSDVAPDGLQITLYPLTAAGGWTPVRGNLDLTLMAEVEPRPESQQRYLQAGFHELARASHLVREVDFAQGPATFALPFARVQPDLATQIATYGVVHARLGVPSQGTFEASDPFGRLRQASPTRDRLQLFRGQRYFPVDSYRLREAY
jgi:hypothetical protein